VLFHALVANLLVLVVLVEEAVLLGGGLHALLTLVGQRLVQVRVVVGRSRRFDLRLHGSEIRLSPESHGDFVDLVTMSGVLLQVLNGNLLLDLRQARGQVESLVTSHRELQVLIFLVVSVRRVARCRRGSSTLEIDGAARKPGELGPGLERPGGVIFLARHTYLVADEGGKIVITGSGCVEVGAHSFHQLPRVTMVLEGSA